MIVAAPKNLSSSSSAPLSLSKMPRKASVMKDVLLEEDFSKMTTGTNEQPDDEAATSDPSDHILVNLAKGESTTGITENAADKKASIVARYNLAGQQIATPAKGLNLVKMSNGKTVKVIVR